MDIEYNLNQSEEQAKVKSLEEIMAGKDKVEIDHCSFFIDTKSRGCTDYRFNGGDCVSILPLYTQQEDPESLMSGRSQSQSAD